MKKLASLLLSFTLLTAFYSQAQQYKSFAFSEPGFNTKSLQDVEEAVYLDKKQSIEYVVTESEEIQFEFNYSAIWINSDKAIEDNNKIYLSAPDDGSVIFQKARVIKADGSIVNLTDDDILEGVYDEDGDDITYYYFALEGLEKGSIVESSSYRKYGSNYYGSKIYLQGAESRYHQLFELICPSHLGFAFKSLNGAPEITKDTTVTDVNRWYVELDTIEKISSQPYLYPKVERAALLYKLNRNNAQNRGDITSYSRASDFVYKTLHAELTKKENKELDKIYKSLKPATDEAKDISRAIENYMKSNFQIVGASAPELENIEFMLENKVMGSKGAVKFYLQMLKRAEIDYQIVLTTDRTELRFDEDFEAFLFLTNYLIYLPAEDIFVAPTEQFNKGEYVPASWMNNYGLFIKAMDVGGVKAVIGDVKFIEPLSYDKSTDRMDIKVNFDDDIQQPEVSIRKEMTGYTALPLQPYVHLFDEETMDNFKSTVTEMVSEDIKAENIELENVEENDFGVEPFAFSFSTTDHNFIEKAGEDYLFKIGELIGPQSEMYQEEERKFDIESDHTRAYYREIEFNVPKGYRVKNLDDLKMNHQVELNGETKLLFTSEVKEENGTYKVVCDEYYAVVDWPLERYEEYREVINAAADFNKIVLVLEKMP